MLAEGLAVLLDQPSFHVGDETVRFGFVFIHGPRDFAHLGKNELRLTQHANEALQALDHAVADLHQLHCLWAKLAQMQFVDVQVNGHLAHAVDDVVEVVGELHGVEHVETHDE